MDGCDGFEIAIERRLHGALGESEAPALDAHLAVCARCRAYEAAARGAEAMMAVEAREAIAQVDWARVERGIRGGIHASLRMLVAAVVTAAWVAGMVFLSTPPAMRADRMMRTLPAMVMVVVLVAFVAAYSARRLVALADREEMFDTYRTLVQANLQWARRMQWATAVIVAFLLYRALAGTAATFDPTVFYGGLALPMAAAWLYLRRVKLPRAEREARDLGIVLGAGR
jgi:uncharacterized membrane protein